jgi:gliding motility-associated-like protein
MMLIADGAVNYAWSSQSGDLITDEGTLVEIAPMDDAWVVLTGSNAACSARDSIYFTVNSKPELDVSFPNAICLGDSALISVTGADSILWQNTDLMGCAACNENIIRPTESEEIVVSGWNGECVSTVSFEMEVQLPPSANLFGDTQVCASSAAELFAQGGDTFIWSTGETGAAITVNPSQNSIYYVVALSGICSDTAMITVEATPLPQITVSGDTTIRLGGQAQLMAEGGVNYYWTPSGDLSCESCANPIAAPSESTTYCVQAFSDFGCAGSACLKVEVVDECQSFFIPNAFAPEMGGHEMNDCLRVFGEECFSEMRLRVFDRWGEMVFEADSFDDCWDGFYQDKKVDAGVFVYYFDGTLVNGEEFLRKGNVTVIR